MRIHDVVVREQTLAVGVYAGQSEQQDAGDYQHRVDPGQSYEEVVDAGAHLGPREDYHGDDVAQDAQQADDVDEEAVGDEPEEVHRFRFQLDAGAVGRVEGGQVVVAR